MKKIFAFLFPFVLFNPLSAASQRNNQARKPTSKFDLRSEEHTVSNPLVLLTGASKYLPIEDEMKENKDPSLPTVNNEMKILYELFHDYFGYEVRSTFFDERGNIFPKQEEKSQEMDGEWLFFRKFGKWLKKQYTYLNEHIESKKYDGLFFVFSGHGAIDITNNEECIITSDGKYYPWDRIERLFSVPEPVDEDLEIWVAKYPKFFFKLACRGSGKRRVVKVKNPCKVNIDSMSYTFYSTSKGKENNVNNALNLAEAISHYFKESVEKREHLSWIDNRIKGYMRKTNFWIDAPTCSSGLETDTIFFSSKRKPLDKPTEKKWWEALENNDVKGVEDILTNYLVDLNQADKDGYTPLYIAALFNSQEVAKLLINAKANLNQPNKYGWTPLYIAARWNSQEVAKLLIDAGANLNQADGYGYTPLYIAAWNNSQDVAKLLIDAGANLNQADGYGYTPLYSAAKKNSQEVAKLLIDAGANVNQPDNNGWTPLYRAAFFNKQEVAKLLIDAGANVNQPDNNGCTPLYSAAKKNSQEVAKLLIDAGADKYIKTSWFFGKTPLDIAKEKGHQEIINLLK